MKLFGMGMAAAIVAMLPCYAAAQDVHPKVELVLGIQIGFHEAIACGARAAADKFGADITVQAAKNYGPADQVPLLNSVLARKPDFIILDPTNRTALVAPLKDVVAQGVKVIAIDTTLDDTSMLTAHIGTDNIEVGRQLAQALAKQIGDKKGKVIMIGSSPGISTVDQRIQGFEQEIVKFKNLEFIGTQYAGNEVSQAQNMFSSILSANPDLIGVASPSENPTMGVAGAIRNAGVSDAVSAAGVDASEAQIELLREGMIDALVIQQPYEIGFKAVESAVTVAKGGQVPADTGTGAVIGTAANIDTPDVSKYLYKGNCI
ncbi:ABC transporter substrate-binding protein [Mesorhizobium sp.]|uniref:ABC transporter substrate-binding protein n=1 Tax=Mesorhizobium sp. TaxID=1871066 RepID=UPI000FE9CEED|nr:ABC transporter substrate-binding protein [Mesorhizobium sp.]RWD73874.1 MAG: LacI family transcriptional regulator [Mesorhizobium sp.]TIV55916.1 MAG: LacI family transcriptional regulator [Mesorhizobium sp.]